MARVDLAGKSIKVFATMPNRTHTHTHTHTHTAILRKVHDGRQGQGRPYVRVLKLHGPCHSTPCLVSGGPAKPDCLDAGSHNTTATATTTTMAHTLLISPCRHPRTLDVPFPPPTHPRRKDGVGGKALQAGKGPGAR